LITLGDAKAVVAETAGKIVCIGVADGKLLWQTPFAVRYNACTPVVDGQTIIFSGSGKGTKAVRVEKQGDAFAAKELWSNENGVQFNTPVVKDGLVFGISDRDNLFCINAETGKTAWTSPLRAERGYGSIVDAGPVLFALTPASELTVFEPSGKAFQKVASYKVTDDQSYAYPVVAGNRVFVKDRSAVTLWSIE
jgi:outer membrane protein assembly factor BamB